MKRYIQLDGIDTKLQLTRVVELHVNKPFFYLWEMNDGTWRLEYSSSFMSGDLVGIRGFKFSDATDTEKKQKGKYPSLIEVVTEDPSYAKRMIHGRLEIDKVVSLTKAKGSRFIHLDYDSTRKNWRLCYWQEVIPDISLITGFSIIRED